MCECLGFIVFVGSVEGIMSIGLGLVFGVYDLVTGSFRIVDIGNFVLFFGSAEYYINCCF